MHKLFLLLPLLLMTTLFSCNRQSQEEIDEELIQNYISSNNLNTSQTASGVYYTIEERGEGTIYPQTYSTMLLNYEGKLVDGTIFDSSYDRGVPNRFLLPQLIRGFGEGALEFARGDKGKIIIPSSLAYGSQQVGSVPSNSVLVFEVDILAVEDEEIADYAQTQGLNLTTTETGLRYFIEEEGLGEKPSLNNAVKATYQLSLLDGTIIEEQLKPVEELAALPLEQTILGWQEGMQLIGRGGKMKLVVPAILGYGSASAGEVPAGSVLVFDVELLDFE